MSDRTSVRWRVFSLALLLALSLPVAATAKDIELEPDGFAGGASSAVSTSAPDCRAGDSAVPATEREAADSRGSAARADEHRPSPPVSKGPTLSAFFDWLWSLPLFGG